MYDKVVADRGFCEKTKFLDDRKGSSEKIKRKNRREKHHPVPPSVRPERLNENQSKFPYSNKQAFSKELEALESLQHQHAKAELQLYAQYGSRDQSTQQLDPSGWEDYCRK